MKKANESNENHDFSLQPLFYHSRDHRISPNQSEVKMNSYLDRVDAAWNDYDGEALARLISFDDPHTQDPNLHVEDATTYVEKILDEGVDDIVIYHLCAVYKAKNGHYPEAYEAQKSVVTHFNKLLSSQKDDNWLLPMMYTICLDLRKLASKADEQLEKKGGKPGATLETAAELMMNCFRTCALDSKSSEEVTKRWGE